jgi:hypothetical protein
MKLAAILAACACLVIGAILRRAMERECSCVEDNGWQQDTEPDDIQPVDPYPSRIHLWKSCDLCGYAHDPHYGPYLHTNITGRA